MLWGSWGMLSAVRLERWVILLLRRVDRSLVRLEMLGGMSRVLLGGWVGGGRLFCLGKLE